MINNNYQKPLFRNHSASKRQIRLNADGTVCDVFSARRAVMTGDPDYQTTFQDPNKGTYILVKPVGSAIRIYDLRKPFANRLVQGEEYIKMLQALPPIILEWLNDVKSKRHQNYIPAGFGWDGTYTQTEINKRQTAQLLFTPGYGRYTTVDREWLKKILDGICRTPKNLTKLRWCEASSIPTDRLLKRTNSIHAKDYIFIDEDGNHTLKPSRKVIGDISAYKGTPIPKNVVKVIELTHGIICDEYGNPIGVQVELYSDEK